MCAWQPIATAPTLDRVLVSGIQPRSGSTIAYWWWSEDTTDEHGVPMGHPSALFWMPSPPLPDADPATFKAEAQS